MSVTVVAEIGINHNGSVETACEMVRAAAQAGADAVKVQHFSAAEFCTPDAMYKGERQVDMFRRYELSTENLARISVESQQCGVHFFGTPASVEHGRELVELGARWIKVGSDDLVNLPLIRGLAELGKPMILSTGMGTLDEIESAIEAFWEKEQPWVGEWPVCVMHCVSQYPTPPQDANLSRMESLVQSGYLGAEVGYSDHTDGIEAAVLSVALGAVMVEKHFTLDRSMDGPDHAFSADPAQFAEMVRRIREAEVLLGDGRVDPGPEELEMRKLARRSVTARVAIRCGETIASEALCLKRPGTGIPPMWLDEIAGKVAARDIAADEQLRAGDWE